MLAGCASTHTASQTSTDEAVVPLGPTGAPLGSLRGSRIAVDTDGGRMPLLLIAGSLTDEDLALLAQTAPNVEIVQPATREEALALAPRAHGMDARFSTPELYAAAPQLSWVQSPSAGVDHYLGIEGLRENDAIVMTNMQGVHGRTIAEHAFAMLLALTRDLPYYVDPAQQGTWNREGSGANRIALHGKTLLVVGLGGIGREVAQIGKGFGMRVLATRRSRAEPPAYVDWQGTADDLPAMLPEADVVVLSVPLTDETRGMINADTIDLMKDGAYLVNVARGRVVETDALVDALERGKLAGACLDVTDPEPLPSDHVLWSMDGVVITPHVSSRSALTVEHWKQLYLENIRRFGAGEPLLNVVDKRAGY